jgi:hypothetical protein
MLIIIRYKIIMELFLIKTSAKHMSLSLISDLIKETYPIIVSDMKMLYWIDNVNKCYGD